MTLARAWTRQLYGAGSVALLAPVTIIAALVVLALSGGFGGLGALGQLLSGPAVPVASSAVIGGRSAPVTAAPPLPIVPASPVARHVTARPAPRLAPSAGSRAPASRARAHHAGRGQLVSTGHGSPAPSPVHRQPAPPAPPVSPPPTAPAPGPVASIVNQVVAVGVSVTNTLPAPLAGLGTGVLESLGQTLDGLLAPQP
jgi:hypothetical protein